MDDPIVKLTEAIKDADDTRRASRKEAPNSYADGYDEGFYAGLNWAKRCFMGEEP